MTVVNQVRRGFYLDSVALMRVSTGLAARPGVEDASLMIGTPSNRELLASAGLLAEEGRGATPADLVIAVRAADAEAAAAALEAARAALDSLPGAGAEGNTTAWRPRTLAGAVRALPTATLALVSVPGEHAAAEAHRALGLGLDVMVFSDNVPLADEVALKRRAHALGRLVMGPDCGTAVLSGVPIAFANAVPRGDVGVVSASGTGLQELSVLLARGGVGLSHGIGVGGRDLGEAVGGLSTLDAIEMLARDPATRRVALVSKPPAPEVAARVLEALNACGKPSVACFLGAGPELDAAHGVALTETLHAAAEHLLERPVADGFDVAAAAAAAPPAGAGRRVRGLFSGGTLCGEAQVVLLRAGLDVGSNAPVPGAGGAEGAEHALLDLGADEFTRGRPHPMIEPQVRALPLREALADASVGAILLDLVLGHGAHPDPAQAVVEAIDAQPAPRPAVVASVCGVDGDPQDLAAQCRKLEGRGVLIAPSNALAAAVAARLAARGA